MSPYRWLTLISRVCRWPLPCSRGCPTFRGFRKVGKHGTGWVQVFSLILALATFTLPASAEWKEKVLYSFQGGSDGWLPFGGIALDKSGNLYGANSRSGSEYCPASG